MARQFIFLDYNATAPLRTEALSLMNDILPEPGNASSVHGPGRRARAHIEKARERLAALISVNPNQITFTSGATESNNAVLKAFAGQRILVGATEHPSVLEAAPDAERIPVTIEGLIDEGAFMAMLEQEQPPALISVMMVNNETGVINDVEKLARLTKKRHPGVHFHTDAVQAAGRIAIDFPALQVDYMSLSAHKIGGAQGVGALVALPGAKSVKYLHGGGQEKRQRAGTENVAGIAGFGAAAEMAGNELEDYQRLAALRDEMERRLQEIAPELVIFGKNAPRVANTSAVSLPGVPAQTQVMALDLAGIAVSSGAACSSGTIKSSHVAQAMHIPEEQVKGAFRISTGWGTTQSDIDRLVEEWSKIYQRTKHSK